MSLSTRPPPIPMPTKIKDSTSSSTTSDSIIQFMSSHSSSTFTFFIASIAVSMLQMSASLKMSGTIMQQLVDNSWMNRRQERLMPHRSWRMMIPNSFLPLLANTLQLETDMTHSKKVSISLEDLRKLQVLGEIYLNSSEGMEQNNQELDIKSHIQGVQQHSRAWVDPENNLKNSKAQSQGQQRQQKYNYPRRQEQPKQVSAEPRGSRQRSRGHGRMLQDRIKEEKTTAKQQSQGSYDLLIKR